MSEFLPGPNNTPGLNTYQDEERLAGCAQLLNDPDFDMTYFELVNIGLLDPRTSKELPGVTNGSEEDRRLNIDQAATVVGVAPPYLRELMAKGAIPYHEFELQHHVMLSDLVTYLKGRIAATNAFNQAISEPDDWED